MMPEQIKEGTCINIIIGNKQHANYRKVGDEKLICRIWLQALKFN